MPGLFDQTERAPGECIVSIDEQEIADLYPFLIEVSVDTSREAAAEAMQTVPRQARAEAPI